MDGFLNGTLVSADQTFFYLFDHVKEEWIKMPSMKTARYHHGCGRVFTEERGIEIVAAGKATRLSRETTALFN